MALGSGDPIQVNLAYDGSTLSEQLTDLTTGGTWRNDYSGIDLAAATGGATAYVGFTGGDGGLNSTQTISDFVFAEGAGIGILPAATAVTLGNGAALNVSGYNQAIGSLGDAAGSGGSAAQVLLAGATLTVGADNTSTTFSGVISGNGNVVKDGTGVFTLGGQNLFTGTTMAAAGTLGLSNSLALAQSTLDTSGTGSVSFGPLTAATLGGLEGSGGLVLENASGAAVNLTVGNNSADTTLVGALSGPGGLTKTGSGRLVLASSENAYAGPSAVQAGVLALGRVVPGLSVGTLSGSFDTTDPNPATSVALSTGASNGSWATSAASGIWADNTTYVYSGYVKNAAATPVTWTFGADFQGSVLLVIDGVTVLDDTQSGTADAADYTLTPGYHSFQLRLGHGTGAVGAASGWTFGFGYDPQGRGSQNFSDYQEMIDPGDGSLFAANLYAPGNLPAASAVTVSAGAVLDMQGYSQAIGSLSGGGAVFLGTGTLTVGGDNTSTTFSGQIFDTGSLVKAGTGTLTLSGPNSYVGPTIVGAGTLALGDGTTSVSLGSSGIENDAILVWAAPRP